MSDADRARRLFVPAALFNWSVAAGLLFLRPWLSPLMGFAPVDGTNLSFLYIAAALVAAFGWAYWCVAQDHRRYRPYIVLGVIGKLLVVLAVFVPWLRGLTGWQLPALASVDLVFAGLFFMFLKRTPSP
jgi:hypothetical protein